MASVKITELSSSGPLTGAEVLPIVQGNETVKVTVQEIANLGGGGGLEGTQYVFVAANGTDIENAAELQAAYNLAVTKATPIPTPKAIGVAAFENSPGDYAVYFNNYQDLFNNFPSFGIYPVIINGVNYNMDYYSSAMGGIKVYLPTGLSFNSITVTDFVINTTTIIAAPGNYNFESSNFVMDTEYVNLVSLDGNKSIVFNSSNIFGTIKITANNIFVKGVDTLLKPFNVENNLKLLTIENCKGGDYSFGNSSFSNPQTISGTFIGCEAGNSSFGGSQGATTSGTFINCVSEAASFGEFATGIFDNCKSGNDAFGVSIASGTFTNCNSGINSFGITTSSGTFRNCIANDYSFGSYGGTASGNFNNCKAGDYSFGPGGSLNAIGTFTYCKAGDWSFGSGTGTFTNCEAGSNSFGAVNLANGTYNYCIAGSNSFGTNMGPSISGQLYYCRLTSGTFRTVTGAGKTVYCVDGNGDPNNQGFTPQNNL